MPQTDKQTDTKKTGTYWSVTGWNDEIERLQDIKTYPPLVQTVWGGVEKCPDSGKLHFQGMIKLRTQQRMTWFKDWLPTAHLQVAREKDALKNYAMKSETAVGEKLERVNTIKYYTADEICILIGSKVVDSDILETPDSKIWFKRSIHKLLREDHRLAGQLMNPSLRNFWCDTANVWIDKAKEQEGEP